MLFHTSIPFVHDLLCLDCALIPISKFLCPSSWRLSSASGGPVTFSSVQQLSSYPVHWCSQGPTLDYLSSICSSWTVRSGTNAIPSSDGLMGYTNNAYSICSLISEPSFLGCVQMFVFHIVRNASMLKSRHS